MPLSHRRKKLLIGPHPSEAGLIERRRTQRPVLVCRAPKRLALKKAAMAGRALPRVDLLAPGNQSKIIGVGEVSPPTSFKRLHISRESGGGGHPKHWNSCLEDQVKVHFDAYGPATRMIAIMPLSS